MDSERTYEGGTADLLERPADRDRPEATERDLPRQRDESVPLMAEDAAGQFRARWEECQRGFVDEPRESVQKADQLVADLIRHLASQFSEQRSRLETQWSRGEEVSTDDLRFSLQHYRSFFNRLLQV